MEKKLLLGVVVVVCLFGSAALALDPMGPPVAGLKQGQFSAGLDYAFSEMNLKFDGEFTMWFDDSQYFAPIKDKLTFKAVEMHKGYVNIGYGIMDNWEAFFRLGGARAETRKPDRYMEADLGYYDDPSSYAGYMEMLEAGPAHDFDTGLAIGFGTKVTFWEDTDLKIGGLFQASWTKMDVRTRYEGYTYLDSYIGEHDTEWMFPADGELEIWELQLAIGATYVLSPRFTIYGGPFWHYLIGDYDFKGEGEAAEYDWVEIPDDGDVYSIVDFWDLSVEGSYDVESKSQFGGYLGAQIDVTDNVVCNAECMLTGDAVGVGTSLIWRF